MAKKYGFNIKQFEVADPGNEQTAIWQQIKRWNPDYTVLRGWGVMTPVAIKTAAKLGYPVSKIIGNIWSNSENDVVPAGAAAKGYVAIATQGTGREWPMVKTIWEDLYLGKLTGKKEGSARDPEKIVGTGYYNLGISAAIYQIEAIRIAIEKFGKDIPMSGRYMRYGLENLNLTDEKLKEYGVLGMMQNIRTSCKDHTGGHKAKFQQWDGKNWKLITKDWIEADMEEIWPLIYERSKQYAKEHNIKPRNCSDPAEGLNYDIPAKK
jgi:branched-chain amino acid transport system substrate-binding protein